MSRCRSCNAEIIWAITENGKKIPLDAEPVARPIGLFAIDTSTDPPLAVSTASERREPEYRSHFATCPNADQHRRSR